MELLTEFWYFITHLNDTLPAFITAHGNMVYALLFASHLCAMPFYTNVRSNTLMPPV